jgi:hypothetical protein
MRSIENDLLTSNQTGARRWKLKMGWREKKKKKIFY